MKIETARLVIRSMQEKDLESLVKLWTDFEVTYYMGGPRNYEEVAKKLKEDIKAEHNFNLWPVLESGNDQLVGHCGIIDKEVEGENEYEIVYMLSKSAWGKGYATEAAAAILDYAYRNLGLRRIIALIHPDNIKSEKVAMKIGLRYEKDTIRPNGETMKVYARNY